MEQITNRHLASYLYIKGLIAEDALNNAGEITTQFEESLNSLSQHLSNLAEGASEEDIQSVFYEAGKIHFASQLRYWFKGLYQVLFEKDDGPRMGQYAILVGIDLVISQIDKVVSGAWFYRKCS